ncbi:MAG TPA: YihY/virulence factor BrkB family protein [Actinomycetota bacterium]|nr:YihY/virulence factor BrkB family protein [Actinomycetota bacterium]
MKGSQTPTGQGIPSRRSEGSEPDTPLDLEKRDWKASVKRAVKEIKQDRIPFIAAGMAYYFFLAIFPALIALIGVLGLAQVDASGLVDSVRASLPGGAGEALTQAIARADRPPESASLIAAVAGIAVALWSASSGFVALQSGLNVAYDVEKDRKFFGARGVALLLLLATAGLGGVPSPIFTFGESTVFTVIGWVVTVIAIMVLFSLLFYLGPNRPSPSWHWVSAGGIVGGLLWMASSLVFGFYVSTFNNYDKTYGPLGGVIVLILWLYLSSLSVLIGGELNSELEKQAAAKGD